jgi:hypothetical protein
VSDIALKRPLPEELGKSLAAYVGCVAGAISIDEYREGLLAAGFAHVEIIDTQSDLNTYAKAEKQGSGCCGPSESEGCLPVSSDPEAEAFRAQLRDLMRRYNINDYAASVKVFALKSVEAAASCEQPALGKCC